MLHSAFNRQACWFETLISSQQDYLLGQLTQVIGGKIERG